MAATAKNTRQGTAPGALNTLKALPFDAASVLTEGLNEVLADAFALYFKTKNFHWHVSGPHFRDYHLLFDEQATEILPVTDALAERVKKIGGTTLRSIGNISRLQRVQDNDREFVPSSEMLHKLMNDNQALANGMRQAHRIADKHEDVATASLLEDGIDQAKKRVWFLFEASREQH